MKDQKETPEKALNPSHQAAIETALKTKKAFLASLDGDNIAQALMFLSGVLADSLTCDSMDSDEHREELQFNYTSLNWILSTALKFSEAEKMVGLFEKVAAGKQLHED